MVYSVKLVAFLLSSIMGVVDGYYGFDFEALEEEINTHRLGCDKDPLNLCPDGSECQNNICVVQDTTVQPAQPAEEQGESNAADIDSKLYIRMMR